MSETDCYCVCHSPWSSCAWCEHCKGDNDVGRHYRRRNELRDKVIEAAKVWAAHPETPKPLSEDVPLYDAVVGLEKFEEEHQ